MAFKIKAGEMVVALSAEDSRFRMALSRTKRALVPLQNAMMRASRISRNLLIGGVGMGALAIKAAAGFEQGMSRVKALSGSVGQDFADLQKKAKELGQATVFTARQSAEAMGVFALAGFNADQIIKAMTPTLNLAAAAELDVASAADIAAKVMGGMGLQASELGTAVDILAKATTSANANLIEIGQAVVYAGPIFRKVGKDMGEMTATIMALAQAGIRGSMAGTTLRQAIIKLLSPSKEAQKHFDKMQFSISDADGKMKSFGDIIDGINEGLKRYGTQVERDAALVDIFGARAGPGMATMLSQGSEAFRLYEKTLRNAAGTASSIARIKLDTLQGTITLLKSKVEGVAISIGTILMPTIRAWAERLGAIATIIGRMTTGQMEALIDKLKTLGKILLAVWVGPKIITGIVAITGVIVKLTVAVYANMAAKIKQTTATAAAALALLAEGAAATGATPPMFGLAAANSSAAISATALAVATWAALAPIILIAAAILAATAAFAYFTYKAYKARAAQTALRIETMRLGEIMKETTTALKELDEAKGAQERAMALDRLIKSRQRLLDADQEELRNLKDKTEGGSEASKKEKERMGQLANFIAVRQKMLNQNKADLQGVQATAKAEQEAEQERIRRLQQGGVAGAGDPQVPPEIKTKMKAQLVGITDMWRRMQEAAASPAQKQLQVQKDILAENRRQTEHLKQNTDAVAQLSESLSAGASLGLVS